LRTTPARKPRTECCCQSVAFIIASIVAPLGDRSIVIRRPCFEQGPAFSEVFELGAAFPAFALETDFRLGRALRPDAFEAIDRFFFVFGIEILHSVHHGVAPHHRSPALAIRPAGQDLKAPMGALTYRSTAPIAAVCQSFFDNFTAQFGEF
jgi:hypothetical protein